MSRYFFRLDDIAPNMNWDNFYRIREIFNRYKIKPLTAVIPDVRDPKLTHWPENKDFWVTIGELDRKGWVIGQHGYRHLSEGNGGILKIHNSGEFGGLDFKFQESLISSGKGIIKTNLVNPEIFIAPRHSFDKNTIKALKMNGFNYISDGIALYPFKKWGIVWLPQILWRPRKGLLGMITVALHPNTMTDKNFNDLEEFIGKNIKKIGNFSELMDWYGRQNIIKKFLVFLINQPFKIFWYLVFRMKHGFMVEKYLNAEAYDQRGENSILEKYVLGLWQPFLKKIISNLSVGKIVVDLGCGTCEYTRSAKNAKKIYAVDVSSEMLKICREKLIDFNQAEIILSDIQNFKMAETADLMIAIGIWEYISPPDLLNTIKKITRRGSKVIVVFPNIYNELNLARSLGRMKKIALRPGFIKKLFKKDFLIIDSASFCMVSWTPKKLQSLILPLWKFCDFIWSPFQKLLPLGVNVYYLFERK